MHMPTIHRHHHTRPDIWEAGGQEVNPHPWQELAAMSVTAAKRLNPKEWKIISRDSYTEDATAWIVDPGEGYLPVRLEYVKGEAIYEVMFS